MPYLRETSSFPSAGPSEAFNQRSRGFCISKWISMDMVHLLAACEQTHYHVTCHKNSSNSLNNSSCLYKTLWSVLCSVFSSKSFIQFSTRGLAIWAKRHDGKEDPSVFSYHCRTRLCSTQFLSLSFLCSSVFFLKCPNLPTLALIGSNDLNNFCWKCANGHLSLCEENSSH